MKYYNKIIAVCLILLMATTLLGAKELQKVSLQLQWLDQFQFAGYYMAKEKGFYADVGLDVELKKFTNKTIQVSEVINKRATYGIGRSCLIIQKSKGKDVVLLSSIFQSSPLVLIARKDSGINSVKDFTAKRVMLTQDALSSSALKAMGTQNKIRFSDMIQQKHSFNIDDLIDKKTDLMASYLSNEPFLLEQKGVPYTIFDPKDYGFDIYSDILFTSSYEIKHHKQRTINFNNASIKGWEYAFNHIDETVELILKKYNTQNRSKEALLYEAKELKKLAYFKNIKLGNIDKSKIQRIYDMYNVMGYVKNKIDLDEFIFLDDNKDTRNFTKEELSYLKGKKKLTVCIKKNWFPYESFENGNYLGVNVDFLELVTKKFSIPLDVKVSENQVEYFKQLQSKQCDIKPFFPKNIPNLIHYVPTTPYMGDYIALVTKMEQPFIYDLDVLNYKKILILKGYHRFIKFIKKQYPRLQIQEVQSIDIALKSVVSGEAFAYIGTALTSSYHIQKNFSSRLKIVNNLEPLEISMGVLDTEPTLLNILNKSINSITKNEKQEIYNRWIATTIEKEINYNKLWQLSGVFSFVLIMILFFYNKQRRLKNSLKDKVCERTVELQQQNKKLQHSIDNFQDLLDATMETIILSDSNQNIIDVNQTGVTVFGAKDKKQIIGMNMLSLLPAKEKKRVQEALSHSVQKPYELKVKKFNGDLIYILASGKNIIRDGKTIRISTLVDISELKRKDEQLLQQSKLAQMGDMIGMIAHQWRQPLNAINATGINLSLLASMKMLDESKVQESSKFVQDQCQKMSATIDTFMNFVKPSKESRQFELIHAIESIMSIMGTQLANHNIKVNIESTKENISIVGYEDLLEQVIINILSNARDAFGELSMETLKDKTINIKIDSIDDVAVIIIEDNAGGIPEHIADKIFNPYFTTKEQGKGTGIGLYMSLDIMRKSFDGDLQYKVIENGSKFIIKCG